MQNSTKHIAMKEGDSVFTAIIKSYQDFTFKAKALFQASVPGYLVAVCLMSTVPLFFLKWGTGRGLYFLTGTLVQNCNLFTVESIQASVYCMLPPDCCSYPLPDVHNRLWLGTGKLLLFVYFISNTTMPCSTGRAEVQISTLGSRLLPMVILLGK